MPAQKKSIRYAVEREELIEKIVGILELDERNSFTLPSLDDDEEKQAKINGLLDDAKKYFVISHIDAINDPSKSKRPYLSIVKNVIKYKYELYSKERLENKVSVRRYFLVPH
jgi:hypothetical protein